MPQRRDRRQRTSRQNIASKTSPAAISAKDRRRRALPRSWLLRHRSSPRTYGIISVILVVSAVVVATMFFALRETFGDDFSYTVYQGNPVAPNQNAKYSELFESGKPVVLNFWAGLCPPCRAEMPALQRVYDQFQDRITLLGLDVGSYMNFGSSIDARSLLTELNITYPTGYAHDRDPVAQFIVFHLPTTVYLTPDGKVFRTETNYLSEERIRENVQALITASAVSS